MPTPTARYKDPFSILERPVLDAEPEGALALAQQLLELAVVALARLEPRAVRLLQLRRHAVLERLELLVPLARRDLRDEQLRRLVVHRRARDPQPEAHLGEKGGEQRGAEGKGA